MKSIDTKSQTKLQERKKNASSVFIKLPENPDDDMAIEKLRDRKLSEEKNAEKEETKVKFQRNLSVQGKKSSFSRVANELDAARLQSRSQFRKKNIQQFQSVSST